MTARVAINGFGRIGRLALRAALESGRNDLEFVAVNDLGSVEANAHLLKYDSTHGTLPFEVKASGSSIEVAGRSIEVMAERNPADLPWGKLGIDIVLECTGIFASKAKAAAHLEAGARKVYFASAAPPVRYPNVYGIDMPAASEFVAYDRTEEEVAELIGADWLVYQTIEDLILAAREGNPKLLDFDCSVFDGEYVTGDIDEAYLARLSRHRSDRMKQLRDDALDDQPVIELSSHG